MPQLYEKSASAWQLNAIQNALFVDLDGTLIDIAPEPEAVIITDRLRDILTKLHIFFNGAVSLCSGRSLKNIDALLHLPFLPVIGLHGLETRLNEDTVFRTSPSSFLLSAIDEVTNFASQETGLIAENKGAAIALHYRCRPDLENLCTDFVNKLTSDVAEKLVVQRGKMVLEIRMPGPDKGAALIDFMKNYPFQHRQPVMFGDDLTDESAFGAVSALGGFGILVSTIDRPSLAKTRVKKPADILNILDQPYIQSK